MNSEFNTGKPPASRILLCEPIAMAISVYFSYPHLRELSGGLQSHFWIIVLMTEGMVLYLGVIIPWVGKIKQALPFVHQPMRPLGIYSHI
jgi:hypothetical protein